MDDVGIGRMLRMMRIRRHWRLEDLATRAGISSSTLGRHERGNVGALESLRRHAAAVGLRAEIRLMGRGADLARISDDEHEAIVNALAAAFRSAGWTAEPEVSFSEWGERGRIDLAAAHSAAHSDRHGAILAIVEVKTELADLQDLLGSLDVKERLAPAVARRLGWPSGRSVVVVLVLASSAHNRAIVAGHATLFSPFASWTLRRDPACLRIGPGRRTLLWIPPTVAGRGRWVAGRRRIRVPGTASGRGRSTCRWMARTAVRKAAWAWLAGITVTQRPVAPRAAANPA